MGIIAKSFGIEALSAGPVGTKLKIPSRAKTNITLDTVIGVDGVFRAIQLLTTMGGGVPFNSWRGAEQVERQPQVIRKPDPWRSRRSWGVRAVTNMVADGNCYLRHHLDVTDGKSVVAAPVLNSFAVDPYYDKSGRRVYRHATRTGSEVLSAEEVTHIWLNEFPGFNKGVGPITASRLMLQGAIDVRDYAGKFFEAVPPGVLSSDQAIDGEYAAAAKQWWHEGEAGEVKVVGKGLSFQPLLIKPEDAQWIEAQKLTVLQVARMTGVPPVRLAAAIEGSSLTYQNLADVNQDYIDTTLDPVYLAPIAAGLTELVPAGQDVRHDYRNLTRRPPKERMQTHKLAIESGVYDADYARSEEGIAGPAPKKPESKPTKREDDAA